MTEFQCRSGCVKCCTDLAVIPVTLGDLYRNWFHREKTGKRTTFFRTYEALCDDWTLIPSRHGTIYTVPSSKVPCRNLNAERTGCGVYGVARYLACATFPEDWLLSIPGIDVSFSDSAEFIRGMDCFQGATLSDERRERVLALRDLIDRETQITIQPLRANVPPTSTHRGKPSKRVQRELEAKLKYISEHRGALRTLRANLINNRALQDYESLVQTGNPGFSYSEEI